MKYLITVITVLTLISCKKSDTKQSKMEQAKTIELVLWRSKNGIDPKAAKQAIINLNNFVKEQPGFLSRSTGISEDGRYLDLVYWTDLQSAQEASEKAMSSEICAPAFETIDEREMTFLHFDIINSLESN